jgi:hypothetical protein
MYQIIYPHHSLNENAADTETPINTAGEYWLKMCKLARKSGMLETAHAAALHASRLGNNIVGIQVAKLCWVKGQQSEALRVISECIDDPRVYQALNSRQKANVS